MSRALVIGGTRGIGLALSDRLRELGWNVRSTGSAVDITDPMAWPEFLEEQPYDLVVFSAGRLDVAPWGVKRLDALLGSYCLHAAAPVALLAAHGAKLLGWWSKVVFISTVGAVNSGAVDLGYGMAKAALEKAARALAEHSSWRVYLIRFDLVDTDMIRLLPLDSLRERPVLSAAEAAEQIILEAEL
jgi:NAD(P)-dependent dehydrogenase (short-subunit alcohol dehydrogenase family)